MWIVVLNSFSTFIFLRHSLSLKLEFNDWLDWLTSKSQGSLVSTFPGLGLQTGLTQPFLQQALYKLNHPPNPLLTKPNYVRLTNKESLEVPECSVKPGLPKV